MIQWENVYSARDHLKRALALLTVEANLETRTHFVSTSAHIELTQSQLKVEELDASLPIKPTQRPEVIPHGVQYCENKCGVVLNNLTTGIVIMEDASEEQVTVCAKCAEQLSRHGWHEMARAKEE